MESRVKLAGHPVHPMLIVFPLGLLTTAVVFDIIYLVSDAPHWTRMAYYMIAAGVIGGLAAAAAGWVDWWAIPRGTRAKRIGLWHGVGNVLVIALFILSWLLRRPAPAAPPTEAIVAALLGVVLATFTGWLGGELVNRLGVGVDPGAHLDAPSSLTSQSASTDSRGGSTAGAGTSARDRRTYPQATTYPGIERRASGSMH